MNRLGLWLGLLVWFGALFVAWERLSPLEQAIGDALERRRTLPTLPGDTWLILVDNPEIDKLLHPDLSAYLG